MNKWIIVTGASSGIGKETVKLLSNMKYKVVLTSRSYEKLSKILSLMNHDRMNYTIIPWDLSDIDSLHDYAKKVKEIVGPISGLVHCAGIQKTMPLSLLKKQIILDVFNLNTFASMLLVSLFSRNGYFADNASFVLISSLATHEGAMGKSVYSASKGAVEGFIPAAATELAVKGIRLNAVVPGIVKTEMVKNFFKNLSDKQKKDFEDSYPFGIGDPVDVANLIEYLLSDKAKWITGECYKIDGGHMIRKA